MNYLNDRAKELLKEVKQYASEIGIDNEGAREHEMKMLAFYIDQYEQLAEYVKKNGTTQVANSGYRQVSPEFSNMNKVYELILKHSKELGFYKVEKGKEEKDEAPRGLQGVFNKSN